MNIIFCENIKKKFTLLIFFLCPFFLLAQQGINISINEITVEKGGLNFWVKCSENGKPKKGITRDQFKIIEQLTQFDSVALIPDEIQDTTIFRDKKVDVISHTVSFLLDLSKEMNDTTLDKAKTIIKKIINRTSSNSSLQYHLTTFNENIILNRKVINTSNIDFVLDNIKWEDKTPIFFQSLMEELRHLKGIEGAKSLIILGSGKNDDNGEIYQRQLPYTNQDIERILKYLPADFHVYAIELTDENTLSKELVITNDAFHFTNDIPNLNIVGEEENIKNIKSNYLLKFLPSNAEFKGEKRIYSVRYKQIEARKDFRLGSANFPVNIQIRPSWINWFLWLIVGIIPILLILGVGSLLIPYIREKEFFRKYVEAYKTVKGINKNDLYRRRPIKEGELVVNKCRQVTLYSSWQEYGQCPNYPGCQDDNCSGAGAPETNSFKSLDGIYLQINWIWFGTIGGLLAWMILTIFWMIDFQGLNNFIASVIGEETLRSISQNNTGLITQTISNNLLVGIAFGTGLMLMLSWMEERRKSRRQPISQSILRIFLRTLASIILSMIIFSFGFFLQYKVGISPYVSGFVSWLLFGLAIGSILSFDSGVSIFNAIVGSIIAVAVAYHVYWGLSELLNIGFIPANLLGMLLMGGLIGSIIVSIVNTLEDYELKVVEPKEYQHTIYISKWLKSKIEVVIGKLPGAYVFVKWEDAAVKLEHARLVTEQGNVLVEPLEEVLINDHVIAKPTPLKNGDIIQLGIDGITKFKFVEK